MTAKTRLGEMLLQWEDLRKQGKAVSAEELCRDCPELYEELQRQIQVLETMDRVLQETGTDQPNSQPAPTQIKSQTSFFELYTDWEPIPGYRLEKGLGKGGFGEVWKAAAPGGFHVALKFVSLNSPLGPKEERSLEVIKTIHHPNLLATFGSWHVQGFLVIAMELADQTLLDRLNEATGQGLSGIPRNELLGYMIEAAKGIDYLNQPDNHLADSHKEAIQHRDIKPQNILLMGGGVKIADFGLLRILKHSVTEHTGSLTVAYAAPEFLMGHTARSSDQYSLAVTYCHLRGGRLPFTGAPGQIIQGHLETPPDLTMLPESERGPVERAMHKDPDRRWLSCSEFVNVLATNSNNTFINTLSGNNNEKNPRTIQQKIKTLAFLGISLGIFLFMALVIERNGWWNQEPIGSLPPVPTWIELDAPPAITFGQDARVRVTVASKAGSPNGNIFLVIGDKPAECQPLIEGSSTFSLKDLGVGKHNLVATFPAQKKFAASSNNGLLEVQEDPNTLKKKEMESLKGFYINTNSVGSQRDYSHLQIEKDQLTFISGKTKKKSAPWTISIDPTLNPKRIDRKRDKEVCHMIYKLEGNLLYLAWADGKKYPENFDPPKGLNGAVTVWTRK